jgi:hypothetical protein
MNAQQAILLAAVAAAMCLAPRAETSVPPWPSPELDGDCVRCWGRTYEFRGTLLPSGVFTQGKNLLDSPMHLSARANGAAVTWSASRFSLVGADDESVRFTTRASGSCLSAECRYAVEFDGCTRVDLRLSATRPVRLESLDLLVPLRARHAELFHHSSVYPVYVWDWPTKRLNAGAVGPRGFTLPFVHHLWLGDDDVGMQVFAESDQALFPGDADSVVTVTPKGSVTLLRLNLLSGHRLSGTWEWSFGFVATPVKPYPGGYHDLHYCQYGKYGIEKNRADGQPADTDHPPFLDELKRKGVRFVGYHESWSDEQSLPRPKNPEDLISLIKACHDRGIGLAVYTGCYMSTSSPQYNKDWDVMPIGDHYQYQRPDNGHICRVVCNNTPYPDLLLRLYATAFKRYGLDGLYLDGLTSPLPCSNTKHGCGYVGRDGKVHPTMPIWRTRDMMKRLCRIVHGQGKRGVIVSHTSSSILLPALAFADTYFEGEHLLNYMKIGSPEYPESLLRAEMCGRHFGIPGAQLPSGSSLDERERARTVCLLHDILMIWHLEHQADIWKAFDSFGMTGARWVPFWEAGSIVKSTGIDSVKVSAYVQWGRGALFVIANLGAVQAGTALTVKREPIGLKADVPVRARDEVADTPLDVHDDTVLVELKPGTFRLVSVWASPR